MLLLNLSINQPIYLSIPLLHDFFHSERTFLCLERKTNEKPTGDYGICHDEAMKGATEA